MCSGLRTFLILFTLKLCEEMEIYETLTVFMNLLMLILPLLYRSFGAAKSECQMQDSKLPMPV
jgi:hypothetical protein